MHREELDGLTAMQIRNENSLKKDDIVRKDIIINGNCCYLGQGGERKLKIKNEPQNYNFSNW